MTFQSLSNLVYSRDGMSLTLESGKYYEFSQADYAKLPEVAKRKLKALDEVEIKKPAISATSAESTDESGSSEDEPPKGKKGRK